jgi:hypothetical protein
MGVLQELGETIEQKLSFSSIIILTVINQATKVFFYGAISSK